MHHSRTVTAVVVLLAAGLLVGATAADTSYIRTAEPVAVTDDDGDGYVSGFAIRIAADTECFECNDESLDDPYIEPYFEILVDWGDGFVDVGGTDVVRNETHFETRRTLPYQARAKIDEGGQRTVRVRVELWDADPLFPDKVDQVTFEIDVESAAADENSPPSAAFTVDAPRTRVGSTVTFDASPSSDPDAPLEAYRWDVDGDGTTDATGRSVTWTFDRPGDYDVRLEVVDAAGATDVAERTVRVTVDTDGDLVVDSRDPFPESWLLPLGPLGLLAALVVASSRLYRRRPWEDVSAGDVGHRVAALTRRGSRNRRRPGSRRGPAGGDGSDDGVPVGADPDADVQDLLDRADARVSDGDEARDRGDYAAAADAYSRALQCYERAGAAAERDDDPPDVDEERLERVRSDLATARAKRDALADLTDRLEQAETLLAEADEAYDEGRQVVARLRYRQARDTYRAARDVADEHGLERLDVDVDGRRFETVEDVDDRRAAAADGLAAAG